MKAETSAINNSFCSKCVFHFNSDPNPDHPFTDNLHYKQVFNLRNDLLYITMSSYIILQIAKNISFLPLNIYTI